MADDHSHNKRKPGPRSRPEEAEELAKLPEFPDRAEFVRTVEMEGVSPDFMTRPMRPALDMTTQRYDVPEAIMELARREQIAPDEPEWVELSVVVREDGTIALPEDLRRKLTSGAVTIRVKIE